MKLTILPLAFALAGVASCAEAPDDALPDDAPVDTAIAARAPDLAWSRVRVAGDVYHYTVTVPIGSGPNAALRLHRVVRERSPGVPRASAHAVLLMHGDFGKFDNTFLPGGDVPAGGVAAYLAGRNLDVWGLDRRWTLPGTDGDLSDFGGMGVAQELDDVRAALTLVRAVRTLDGSGGGKLALGGFSHGAQLAYLAASQDAARPAAQRNISALVALDFYAALPADAGEAQALACNNADYAHDSLAAGITDAPNDFFVSLGQLASAAPDDESPIFGAPFTNRLALAYTLGLTYQFAPYAPRYHLLAPTLDADGLPDGYAATSDAAAAAWTAHAPPHQSMRESGDLEGLICGREAPVVDAPLARIRVPLLYLGAAGGAGALGAYSTTQVSSTDVTVRIARRLAPGDEALDVGHGDLLFASDAPTLAWQPLANWLASH